MAEPIQRKRFFAPALLHEALGQVADLARKQSKRVALVGGFAIQMYGSNRLIGDVDLAVAARLRSLPRGTPLAFGGVGTVAANGVPVHLVLRGDKYAALYAEAIERAVAMRGLSVPIARPEHLAAMKMAAGRRRDEFDLHFLIAERVVDIAKTRKVVREHLGPYAEDKFEYLAAEVAWKASRGRT